MFKVCVPATSANLGPGFDVMGISLNMYSDYYFERAEELLIEGCPEEFRNENNLVVQAFKFTLKKLGIDYFPIHLIIDADIPVSRGLGSSSACIVAGIYAADHFTQSGLSKQELVNIAVEIEGHPDNVAPCIFGGLVSSFVNDGHTFTTSIPIHDKWRFVAIIPDYEVLTEMARKVIKWDIGLQTSVYTAGHLVGLISGLQSGDSSIVAAAQKDVIHEPYRIPLIKDYEVLKERCLAEGAVSFFISGSGSTMIALCDSTVSVRISAAAKKLFPMFRTEILEMSREGVIYGEV